MVRYFSSHRLFLGGMRRNSSDEGWPTVALSRRGASALAGQFSREAAGGSRESFDSRVNVSATAFQMRQLRQEWHTDYGTHVQNLLLASWQPDGAIYKRRQTMNFDPYAQANPWMSGAYGIQPYGFGSQPSFTSPLGFGSVPQYLQFGSPGYLQGASQIPPQTWFGGQHLNPLAQQAFQQIPQLVQNAQQLAQQVPQLIQQIPQLLQQNPQLIQQAPQLQQVPQFLHQAAALAQQIPHVLQALCTSPATQTGAFGGPFAGYRPFS